MVAQQPDGWSRNPDGTWIPPIRAVQHPPNAALEVPPHVQRSVIRDGAVLVRDAEDDLVVRLGKLSDGTYGLQLLEGSTVIQQMSGTTLTIRNSAGTNVITLGQDAGGDAALRVFDASGNDIVILGEQANGTFGLVVNDTSGNEVLRLGDLGSSHYGLQMKNSAGTEVVRVGKHTDSTYDLSITEAGDDVRLSTLAFGTEAAEISTFESTSSVTYADLATVGPQVTATIGPSGRALVYVSAETFLDVAAGQADQAFMSFAVSGATTLAADNARSGNTLLARSSGDPAMSLQWEGVLSRFVLLTSLNAGSNTFTAKYRTNGVSLGFESRTIVVMPF